MNKPARWHPKSWMDHDIKHIPTEGYLDSVHTQKVIADLKRYPPLVLFEEISELRLGLSKVADEPSTFVIMGGDCAESFDEFSYEKVMSTAECLVAAADDISTSCGFDVISVGRIAGQFAKPRSKDTEQIQRLNPEGTIEVLTYRGDIINGADANPVEREPDPQRMLAAYYQSAATLNLIRAAVPGPFFTAHEALLLPYEEGLTKMRDADGLWYDTSAHFLWIGDRTRFLGSAHVEFLRGVQNPIGIKCGPSTNPQHLLRMLDLLDPKNEPGRITLITRYGWEKVAEFMPGLVSEVERTGRNVIWMCDPMHGNVETDPTTGLKTRRVENIIREIELWFYTLSSFHAKPGGVHLEMTGTNVTECADGVLVPPEDLTDRYRTFCDPRLNAEQTTKVVQRVAAKLRGDK